MRKSKIIYKPELSVKKNAENNGVSISAIRWYIRTRGIDRKGDNKLYIINSIAELRKKRKDINYREAADYLKLSLNTVKKYWEYNVDLSNNDNSKLSAFDIRKRKFLITSVSENQEEILVNILRLYIKNDTFDCDLTFSKGGFYKKFIPVPKLRFDKYPQQTDVNVLDEAYQISNNSLKSIIIDLPFLIGERDVESRLKNRFNCFRKPIDLYETNKKMIDLAYLKLSKKGFMIVKTMDLNYCGTQHWVCNFVHNYAVNVGFRLEDVFILIAKNRLLGTLNTTQKHSRKYHSYFLVFQKK